MRDSQVNDQQRYLSALHECRDMALIALTSRISDLFANVEPALLDFIDKADTNQSQFQFIDAISAIQSKRDEIESRFREEISRGFTEFGKGQSVSYPLPLLESQYEAQESLSLVNDEELDQRLSLQTMVDKAERNAFQLLFALKRRLAMVRGGSQLKEQDIPGGTVHAASAFQISLAQLNFNSNILLILYALFDKFVMQTLEGLYTDYNQILIDAGIFPNLKFEAPKTADWKGSDGIEVEELSAENLDEMGYPQHPSRGGAAPAPTRIPGGSAAAPGTNSTHQPGGETASAPLEPGTPNAVLGEELFNSIRDLMSSRRRQDPRYAQHPDVNPAMAGTQQMVDTPTLARAIGDIQPGAPADYLPQVGAGGERPRTFQLDEGLLDQVRERLIEEREKLFQGVDRNTIPSADLDTIELVGMLFEHVLNEDDLPNIAKALISHLHTPYLKVAILDHHFLIDSRHIARRLLNLMVDAGRIWIEESDLRRGIYYPMQEGVNRILAEFRDEIRIFEEVTEKLTKQIEELEQKAKVVEARTKEAARGRERLETARLRAERVVRERIGSRRFHPVIERFLNHAWLDRMILMMLRDPNIEDSLEWKHALTVVDDIVWIHEARNDPTAGAKVMSKLAGLRQRIEEGLSSMGDFHQPDFKALFDLLASYAVAGAEPDELVIEAPKSAKGAPEPKKSSRESEPHKAESPRQPLSEEEKKIAESLRKVKFGTWFELADDHGTNHRLKLSWYSPVTQKYMFVDKSGAQALVTPIEVLARKLAKGQAKMMKQPALPFVDRALDAVLAILQKPFS